jgi:hypothetical protein
MAPCKRFLRPVRAPRSPPGAWLHVARPLTLRELRRRFVLLEFWTFC